MPLAPGFRRLAALSTLPALVLGLYTRWFDHRALLVGWLVGVSYGTLSAISVGLKGVMPLHIFGLTAPGYIALYALVLNIAVTIVFTAIFRAMNLQQLPDQTQPSDYHG